MDYILRSWAKAVGWQLLGLTCMLLVGLFVTGSWSLGGQMAFINAALGFGMFYFYERARSRISGGRAPAARKTFSG